MTRPATAQTSREATWSVRTPWGDPESQGEWTSEGEYGDVVKMVLRRALLMVGLGVPLGLAGSFALTRVNKSALYGVTATDPATYVAISALLLLVAIIACLIPTRRAVAVHPTIALRYE